jgi:hypothetical protein
MRLISPLPAAATAFRVGYRAGGGTNSGAGGWDCGRGTPQAPQPRFPVWKPRYFDGGVFLLGKPPGEATTVVRRGIPRTNAMRRCDLTPLKSSGAVIVSGWCYLMRFQPTSAVPPTDAAVDHFKSSPVKEMIGRFCSVPVQFGYELPSILSVTTLSATV